MKHKITKYRLPVLLMALVLVFGLLLGPHIADAASLPAGGHYDAGGFAGDSDWGGSSDSDWGSSSDWDSGSSYYDDDYSGGGGGSIPGWLVVLIIAFVIIMAAGNRNKSKSGGQSQGAVPVAPARPADISALLKKDPAFSKPKFLEQVGNMYVQMQDAWEQKDFEPMRMLMTDALYNQFVRQLQPYIDNKQTNKVERIAVLSSEIIRYAQDDQNDVLTVNLQTRIVDYVVDDASGQILRGSNTRELFMTYEWTLIRDKNMQTVSGDGMSHVNCPNCGAPMEIKQSGRCEYCDTVVTLSAHDWMISGIRGISQRSGQ